MPHRESGFASVGLPLSAAPTFSRHAQNRRISRGGDGIQSQEQGGVASDGTWELRT